MQILKACVIGVALLASSTQAAEFIVNGGFETGNYTGWTANVQGGSNGGLFIVPSAGTGPVSGLAYATNANGGNFFSITDMNGPGSYSLTQSFTLATSTTVTISFDHFANNYAGVTFNNGRDYTNNPNQNAVVDLLLGSAGAFSELPGDVVAVLYGPGSDSFNNPNPWTSYSSTLTLAAGTYTLRFAETDNQSFFNQGVDNVSVMSLVPEPTTWAMLLIGFGAVGAMTRRTRKSVAA